MGYSLSILNKDIKDFTYVDIVDFFSTKKDETLNLGVKSYLSKGRHRLFELYFRCFGKSILPPRTLTMKIPLLSI